MGYKRPSLHLVFADPEFEGLEVRSKRFSCGEMFDVGDRAASLSNRDREKFDLLCQTMADKILSWNLEDDDGLPIAVDAKAIAALDEPFLAALLRAMTGAAKGNTAADGPFETPPHGGDRDLEADIPMSP